MPAPSPPTPAAGDTPAGEPLRLALVLSGAVALGSFEAGVVHELLTAVAAGAPVTVDLIAGSSAGGLIGAITARSLVMGSPFARALSSWTGVTLHRLTAQYQRPQDGAAAGQWPDVALLSTAHMRRMAAAYLIRGARGGRPLRPRYPAPRLALLATLTNLDGLPGTGIAGDEYRYAEAVTFTFSRRPPDDPELQAAWSRVARVVVAGASFPGAFDPAAIDWEQRLRAPGPVAEHWENDPLLADLNRRHPGLQARMRFADGGIMDNQPLERAMGSLIRVTGGPGEAGPEALVFDPRRCFIFVEPDPPVTALEEVRGAQMGLFTAMGRALRLLNIASSPYVSRRRVLADNGRIVRLLEFLAVLGQRMREGFRPGSAAAAAAAVARLFAAAGAEAGVEPHRAAGDEPGAIPPAEFLPAVRAFYRWLADAERSEADLSYMERIGARRLAQEQAPMGQALRQLRAAYLGLAGLDPADPGRYQRILEEAHATLALSLGLNRPWVLLSYIAPADPRLLLRGEEANHFGGFFSRDFLRHDFAVGRHYARQWLAAVLPAWLPPGAVPPPRPAPDGITWRTIVDNLGPLQRMTGRLIVAAGWPQLSTGRRALVHAAYGVLGVSAAASLLWALAWPVRWLTGQPDLVQAQAVLAAGGALFPLALLTILLMVLPRELYRALLDALLRRRRRRH